MAVYAVVIGDIIDTTRRMFHWNQNIIMHMEIWKRFLMARDEVFKTEDETLIKAIKTVRELINEYNLSSSFSLNWKIYHQNGIGRKRSDATDENEA